MNNMRTRNNKHIYATIAGIVLPAFALQSLGCVGGTPLLEETTRQALTADTPPVTVQITNLDGATKTVSGSADLLVASLPTAVDPFKADGVATTDPSRILAASTLAFRGSDGAVVLAVHDGRSLRVTQGPAARIEWDATAHHWSVFRDGRAGAVDLPADFDTEHARRALAVFASAWLGNVSNVLSSLGYVTDSDDQTVVSSACVLGWIALIIGMLIVGGLISQGMNQDCCESQTESCEARGGTVQGDCKSGLSADVSTTGVSVELSAGCSIICLNAGGTDQPTKEEPKF